MEDKDFQKRLKAIDKLLLLKFNYGRGRWEIYRTEMRIYPLNSPTLRKEGIALYVMEDYPLFVLRIQTPSGGFREPDLGIIQQLQKMDRWRKERPVLDFLLELRKAEWEEERQREKIWS